jgi:hypothetical protein
VDDDGVLEVSGDGEVCDVVHQVTAKIGGETRTTGNSCNGDDT